MNLLLDTHVWIWAVEEPTRLGARMRKLLLDEANTRAVCTVSTLEITRLVFAGDLVFQITLAEWVEQSLRDLRAESIPVTHEIAMEAYRLPEPFHRDPADRELVACARLHGLTLATADERILEWKHVPVVNATK